MELLAKTLKRAGLGFFIGVFIGNVISAFSGWPDGFVTGKLLAVTGGLAPAVMVQTLLSGVLGAVSFAGVSLYDIESWPLLRIAVVHYLIIEAVYMPIAFFLGWITRGTEALIWLAFSAVTYCIIYVIMWLFYRRQVRELNELNEQRKRQTRQTKTENPGPMPAE